MKHEIKKFRALFKKTTCTMISMMMIIFSVQDVVLALPQVDEVVSGEATIQYIDANTLHIDATDQTIINFSSFDVQPHETVTINLGSTDAMILNRVIGGDASQIFGDMNVDGILFFVNESGIHIGANANVMAGGVLFSTRDISNTDFINGNFLFKRIDKNQMDRLLLNEGTITVREGSFGVLLAGAVDNAGKIIVPAGTIELATGDAVLLDIANNGRISIAIQEEVANTVYDYQGNPITDQIKSSGTLEANAGTVILDAQSLPSLFEKTINLTGITRANSVESVNGVIRILADDNVHISGTLEASQIEIGESNSVSPQNVDITAGVFKAEDSIDIIAQNKISSSIGLEAQDISFVANEFDVQAFANEVRLEKLAGKLTLKNSSLTGDKVTMVGEGLNLKYLNSSHVTFKAGEITADNDVSTYFYGDITLHNFKLTTPDYELHFEPGKTYTFKDSLTILGAMDIGTDDQMVKMWSHTYGETWTLDIDVPDYELNFINISDAFALKFVYIPIGVDGGGLNSDMFYIDPVYDGGGATDNWSDGDNWVGNAVPVNAETVTFDGTFSNNNVIVDNVATWSNGDWQMINGYSGEITINTDITVNNWTQSSGTIEPNANINITGDTAISGGTFKTTGSSDTTTFGDAAGDSVTISGTGSLEIRSSDTTNRIIINAGTWTSSDSSTISYTGNNATDTKILSAISYNNLTIGSGAATETYTLDGNITVAGNLTLNSSVTLDTDSSQSYGISLAGNWSNSGTFTPNAGTVTFNKSSGTQTLTSGGTGSGKSFYNLTHSGAGTLQLLTNDLDVDNNLTLSAGTINANSQDITVGGNFSNAGSFTPSIMTLTFDGSGTQTLDSGGVSLYSVVKSGTGTVQLVNNALTLAGDYTNSSGTFDANDLAMTIRGNTTLSGGLYMTGTAANVFGDNVADSINISAGDLWIESDDTVGDITANGTVSLTGGTVTYKAAPGTNTSILFGLGPYNNLVIDSVGSTYTLNGNTVVGNDFTITNGTVALGGNQLSLAGNWSNSGTFTPDTGTVNFTGTGTQTLTSSGTEQFFNLTHSGSGTLQLLSDIDVDGTFTNSAGTFDANGKTMTMSGDWNNAATFTANGNTVIFDGTETSNIYGSTTFYNLTSLTPGKTLAFEAGTTQTITNKLTLTGSSANRINLNSQTEGSQWLIDVQGTHDLSYLNVQDSKNLNSTLLSAMSSVDLGNNINWLFPITLTDSMVHEALSAMDNVLNAVGFLSNVYSLGNTVEDRLLNTGVGDFSLAFPLGVNEDGQLFIIQRPVEDYMDLFNEEVNTFDRDVLDEDILDEVFSLPIITQPVVAEKVERLLPTQPVETLLVPIDEEQILLVPEPINMTPDPLMLSPEPLQTDPSRTNFYANWHFGVLILTYLGACPCHCSIDMLHFKQIHF